MHQEEEKKKEIKNKEKDDKNEEDEIHQKIIEENKKLLEKINQSIKNSKNNYTKRLKLKKKEDIIEIVLKKLNSN